MFKHETSLLALPVLCMVARQGASGKELDLEGFNPISGLISLLLNTYLFVCVCVSLCVRGTEDNRWESVFSFHLVGSELRLSGLSEKAMTC